jgi:hypothetical protein
MDKTVILWDVASGKILRKFRGHVGKQAFQLLVSRLADRAQLEFSLPQQNSSFRI